MSSRSFSFFPLSMGWLCVVEVFGLIDCSHYLPALNSQLNFNNNKIIIILIIIIIGMWKEWMITVWPQGCWWPKSVEDGYGETEVRLNGWCEGGLRQQRNDGGGSATMRERSEREESPGTNITEWVSLDHSCLALCSFAPPSWALVVISWRGERCRYMMPLGWTVKWAQLLKIKAQESSRWATGCILMIVCVHVCVCYLTWHDYS